MRRGTRAGIPPAARQPSRWPTTSKPRPCHGAAALVSLLLPLAPAAEIDLASYLRLDGRQLDLRGTPVEDADLAVLGDRRFARVEEVLLARTAITDSGLAWLRGLAIRKLDLFGTQVTDAGLKHLRDLPLRTLVLSGTAITDAGLKDAAPGLDTLSLAGTAITGRGLADLRGRPVRVVDLSRCPLGDGDVERLRELPKLAVLDLSYTRVSNAALNELGRIPSLRELYVLGTDVSGDPLERFRALRPDVKVTAGAAGR